MHLLSLSVHLTACSYLMLEFPSLAVTDPSQHIAEIGCGCGSGEQRGMAGWVVARGRYLPALYCHYSKDCCFGGFQACQATEMPAPALQPALPQRCSPC